MEKLVFDWSLGYSEKPNGIPQEWFAASVPGAVQLDYAKAKSWPPFYEGANFEDYAWMEDVYWHYRAPLKFDITNDQCAWLVFHAIDYKYDIFVDGNLLLSDEGMFTPVRCDVSAFSGKECTLEVRIHPCPKADDSGTRDQARKSCKAAACYGWDWHPRLISAGIWDEAYLLIESKKAVKDVDVSYILNDTYDKCDVTALIHSYEDTAANAQILFNGIVVSECSAQIRGGQTTVNLSLENPALWFPIGYGEQPLYTLRVTVADQNGNLLDEKIKRFGIRRSRLVMNEGSWRVPVFPKSRACAPATLEINGVRVFAKGSNWVNAQVFPGEMDEALYARLLNQAKECNMNILRIWGGGFVNKESFYSLCDELGIMVWQEFPLACNEYPDEDEYLSVLKKEATGIVRRLRSHPSVVMWCGGNELFNSWSGMTEQHHALRLLDSICYQEDRYTPFIMTSPLNGMAHGHYCNYDETTGQEFITNLIKSKYTAYTEFGCPSMSSMEELRKFLSDEDFTDCNPSNAKWVAHHGFRAWLTGAWIRKAEVEYFFGGYQDVEDLVNKTQFIQAMCYRSMFEESRRQWPYCSMALNWCYNEPWPTAGNNSLIHWSGSTKPAYDTVKLALRERIASARVNKHLWWDEENFQAEIWLINESLSALDNCRVKVSYAFENGEMIEWGSLHRAMLTPQSNCRLGEMTFNIPKGYSGKLILRLEVEQHPEMNSEYIYLCRSRQQNSTVRMLNV